MLREIDPRDYPGIRGVIDADLVLAGRGVVVEPGVEIRGKHGRARLVVLGDYCYIGHGAKIFAPEFRLGDYSKLHAGSYGHGLEPLRIGRNGWIGGGVVLDSMGGLTIDDGVGIGTGSQLWTHIRFGDVVEGCRFDSVKPMHVGKDAWFVGHCLVSPVTVGERSMAMLGSVITHAMQPNHVYGGVPAVDLTGKVGPQFAERTVEQKADVLWAMIGEFERAHPEHKGKLWPVTSEAMLRTARQSFCETLFDVSTRTYNQTHSAAEVAFLKEYTPSIKFTPYGAPSFVDAPVEALAGEVV